MSETFCHRLSFFVLTDCGDTIQDLRASGCDLETSKRRELLAAALNGFGVRREGDALLVKATTQDFSLRKHNLVQAILAVNDLFYLAVPVVASLFLEDVTAWLELHDIRFTPNVKFTGRSGYDHTFDFVVRRSRRAPERLIRAVNRPSRVLAEAMAFSWVDTKEVRPLVTYEGTRPRPCPQTRLIETCIIECGNRPPEFAARPGSASSKPFKSATPREDLLRNRPVSSEPQTPCPKPHFYVGRPAGVRARLAGPLSARRSLPPVAAARLINGPTIT